MLDVFIINPQEILFEGKARSVILPGEYGVFEILPYHKEFMSRLLTGAITVDDKSYFIKRGIAKVDRNKVTIVIENLKEEA